METPVLTSTLESAALKTDRVMDFACASFIARTILGFALFFTGLSRFHFGFLEYAKRVGAIPYASAFIPASALFAIGTVVPCFEILLGIMLLIGLRTRQVLLILGVLIFLVTAVAGVAGLVAAADHIGPPRADGSGYFGPTGMSVIFLKDYTYPQAALVLFLLLLPVGSDRYSVDNLLNWMRRGASDETARAAAILFARVLGALLWIIGGINKVFIWGPIGHARGLFVVPYAHSILPVWSLWATGTVIPFLEFIFPALAIIGLWIRPSLYILGGILITVSFGHLLMMPVSAGGLEDFILSRGSVLLLVLMFPPEADYYSIDDLLRRRRLSASAS